MLKADQVVLIKDISNTSKKLNKQFGTSPFFF